MIPPETLRELTQLRERVAYLEERERLLFQDRDHAVKNICMVWPAVTATHARMLWAMARGQIMERESLLALIGHDDSEDIRLVDSQVKRIRERLPGIAIRSHYGLGYELAPPWTDLVRAAATGRGAT